MFKIIPQSQGVQVIRLQLWSKGWEGETKVLFHVTSLILKEHEKVFIQN